MEAEATRFLMVFVILAFGILIFMVYGLWAFERDIKRSEGRMRTRKKVKGVVEWS